MVDSDRISEAVGRPYIYLFAISILFFILYIIEVFLFQFSSRLSTWLGRLAATSFGSYLTVILVDLSIKKKEERERTRVKRIALERLSGAVNSHIEHLANWYIVSIDEKPESVPESYTELFDDEYIEQVKRLDFSKEYPTAGENRNPTWMEVSELRLDEFSEAVEDIIGKYGLYMDPEMIGTLQELGDSEIYSVPQSDILQRDQQMGVNRDYNLLAGQNVDYYLAKHISLLLDVIEWYEEDPELRLIPVQELDAWRDDTAPHPSSAKLAKDVDDADPMYGMGPSYPIEDYH